MTCFSYNDQNQLESITHPSLYYNGSIVQPTETYTYDLLGHLILHKNKDGYETHTTCNHNGGPVEITYPDGTKEQFEYYPSGALYKKLHKNKSCTLYHRDCLNQVLSEEIYSQEGVLLGQIKKTYKGNLLIQEEDAEGLITTYRYDGAGRLSAKASGLTRITYKYDSSENLFQEISWISENDAQVREYAYDQKNQIVSEISKDLNGIIYSQIDYEYNSFGQKTKVKIGNSVSQYFYSSKQELIKKIDPEGNITEYAYEYPKNGLVGVKIQTTDPLGNQLIEIHDSLGRLMECQRSNTSLLSKKKCSYNLEGDLLKLEEDKIIDGMIHSTYSCEWDYDPMHKIISKKEGSNERLTSYTYNEAGQKQSCTKPDGVTLHYTYDAKGRLLDLSTSDNSVAYRYTYNKNDQVTKIEDLTNFLNTDRIYNSNGWLEKEIFGNGLSISYNFDSIGRKIQMTLPENLEVILVIMPIT